MLGFPRQDRPPADARQQFSIHQSSRPSRWTPNRTGEMRLREPAAAASIIHHPQPFNTSMDSGGSHFGKRTRKYICGLATSQKHLLPYRCAGLLHISITPLLRRVSAVGDTHRGSTSKNPHRTTHDSRMKLHSSLSCNRSIQKLEFRCCNLTLSPPPPLANGASHMA